MVELDPLIRAFYAERYVEDDRLVRSGHGQLEFLRTQELVRRYLPGPGATVLDVGGATGVHARWLAVDGYAVTLVDPVAEHVAKSLEIGTFEAMVGDARKLEQANAYFHHADELRAEFHQVGLTNIEVLAVEGPAAATLEHTPPADVPHRLPSAILLARLLENDPHVISTSFHFLAFGRA